MMLWAVVIDTPSSFASFLRLCFALLVMRSGMPWLMRLVLKLDPLAPWRLLLQPADEESRSWVLLHLEQVERTVKYLTTEGRGRLLDSNTMRHLAGETARLLAVPVEWEPPPKLSPSEYDRRMAELFAAKRGR
jgi:hypothetical protein